LPPPNQSRRQAVSTETKTIKQRRAGHYYLGITTGMESSSSIALRRSKRQSQEKFLSKVILPAIRGQSCPVCLKDFGGEEDYRRVAVIRVCLHAYCLDCIRKWSDIKRKCPLCNSEFNSWFCRIILSTRNFSTEKLPVVRESRRVTPLDILSYRQRWGFVMSYYMMIKLIFMWFNRD
jgi:hypothetical protein